jgi:alkylated DNA repair dioxygenase AlkB
MQLSLLDRGTPARDLVKGQEAAGVADHAVNWARSYRIDLGGGAWLELVRGWSLAHAGLFELFRQSADWEEHERQMYERVVLVPRLVASCPGTRPGQPWTGERAVRVTPHHATGVGVRRSAACLRQLQGVLSRRYEKALGSISLAYYRSGSDSVAFHGDRLGALRQDTVVAILSLGAPRHFLLRRAAGSVEPLPWALLAAGVGVVRRPGARGGTFALSVDAGDLLVMGGNCQETWEHSVPKQAGAGPRIAVMFRERADEGEGALRNVRGPS